MTYQPMGHNAQDAMRQRDEGIAHAAMGAESVSPGWGELAYSAISALCEVRAMDTPRLGEDIRKLAYVRGLPIPSDERAWGHVFTKARRMNLLKRAGYAKAASSHLSEKPLWIAAGALN